MAYVHISSSEIQKTKNVFFVGLLSFFGGIGQDIFSPILPLYLTSVLGLDKAFVGFADGVVTACSYLFKVIAGFLSDRFKKQKPIVFAGYLLSGIARPLLALVSGAWAIVGLRAMDGMGKGIKDPPKDVLIAGSAQKQTRGRSFGIARMLDTMGSVAGPLLLFVLLALFKDSQFAYHWILLLSAVPLVITLCVLAFFVKENNAPSLPVSEKRDADVTQLPRVFFVFLGIIMVFTLGNSSDAFLILRARQVGVTLIEIPLVIALFNFAYAVAAVPFGALSDKIGRIPTMLIGWSAYALVYAGFAFASHAYWIWFLYALYGIYYATSEGIAKALIADMVPVVSRGRAFGLYGAVIGLATLPASIFMGFLWDRFGAQPAFLFGAGMACVAAVVLLVFSWKFKRDTLDTSLYVS